MISFSVFRRPARTVECGLVVFLLAASASAQQANVRELLQQARSGSGGVRYAAIDDLGQLPAAGEPAVELLTTLLDDNDPQVRWRSARALGRTGKSARSAVPQLRRLFAGDDPVLRIHAAIALGRIGDASNETVEALVAAVTGDDAQVARAAIAALRNLNADPKLLATALDDVLAAHDQATAVYALEAVVEKGADATPLLIEALRQPRACYWACVAIEEIGPDAQGTVPTLTQLISETTDTHILTQAMLALAKIGPAARPAAPQIDQVLSDRLDSDQDDSVALAAAYALGAIGATESQETLRTAKQANRPLLQMIASASLSMLNPDDKAAATDAVRRLTDGLKSDDPITRMAAAEGLEHLQAPAELVAPAMINLANDPDPNVVANVADALVSLGNQIVPHAAKALRTPELRRLALQVLGRLGPEAKLAIPELVAALDDQDPQFRSDVQYTLALIGPGAHQATDRLAEGLSSQHENVRHSALYALRQIGPSARQAVPALKEGLRHQDEFDRLASAWALASIAADDPQIVQAVLPVLKQALDSDDEFVRVESAMALGELGPAARTARQQLSAMSDQDRSPQARDAAKVALERIL